MRTRGTQLPQAHRRRRFLDLLGAPPAICLAHVARGFDRRDKLEGDVADADDANNDSCDGANDATAEKEATEEEVDYNLYKLGVMEALMGAHLQTPRPAKEKRNGA
jgi:hypothetical protein